MAKRDNIVINVDADFLKWWKTTIMGNDRQEKMLLAWWGWKACKEHKEEVG